jgi:dipeptidase
MSFTVDGQEYLNERAIATQQTGFWFVAQARKELPDCVGGLFWFGVDDAGTSPLTPVYACSHAISEHYAFGNGTMVKYSPTAMFWMVNRIAQFAYLRYNQIGAEVREVIDAHENAMIELIAKTDEEACGILAKSEKKAVKYLTNFSVSEADNLFNKWKNLDEYLLVKYIDGNTKKQEADGSFTTNAYTDYVPETPNFPGYTEEFKRTIAESKYGNNLKSK